MGTLQESFTGEHVAEPRRLICLYGPPLLHVDFNSVSMNDYHEKVENQGNQTFEKLVLDYLDQIELKRG